MKESGSASRSFRDFWRQRDGAGAAEFALVLLPMMFLTVAIFQGGSLLFLYNDMHNAAREAVRAMVVNENLNIDDEIGVTYNCEGSGGHAVPVASSAAQVACGRLAGYLNDFSVRASLGGVPAASASCREITVTITAPMSKAVLFDMFGAFGNDMTASSTMITEFTHGGAVTCQ